MNLRKLKSIFFALFVLLFASSMTFISCTPKETNTEEVEEVTVEEVSEEAEHPTEAEEAGEEHPTDSTASEEGEHPSED